MIKLTSWRRPKDVALRVSLLDVFRTFLGRFSKTERIWRVTNFSVSNTHIWWTKNENITTNMCFVLMFKIDALGSSQLGISFPDDSRTFPGRYFEVFHATHSMSTIENNTTVMGFVLCLKLTSWRCSKDINMKTSL